MFEQSVNAIAVFRKFAEMVGLEEPQKCLELLHSLAEDPVVEHYLATHPILNRLKKQLITLCEVVDSFQVCLMALKSKFVMKLSAIRA